MVQMNADVRKRGLCVWCLFLLAALGIHVSAQVLITECVHRDSTGRVIYLENEYRDADTTLYYCAYSDGGRLLKQWTVSHGDTLVEVFRCHELTERVYPQPDFDEWLVSSSSDSTWYSALSEGVAVWDTALTREAGEKFWDLKSRSETDYAALVFSGAFPIALDRAVARETWEYTTSRGQTCGLRVIDGTGRITTRQTFVYKGNSLVAHSYFGQEKSVFDVDHISWNSDSTTMMVKQKSKVTGRFECSVRFRGDTSVFSSRNGSVTEHWQYDRTPWHVRTRKAALGEGPLCYSKIAKTGVCLLKTSTDSAGNRTENKHRWSTEGRLLGTEVYRNGLLERRIEYIYH